MKNQKTIVKNLIMVLLSNTLILLSSIVVGLIIPKILGVTNYGYYKIFTLYAGYTSLLHFGFLDGILLKHGDEYFNELNKKLFRLNSHFFFVMQICISFIFILISILIKNRSISFILISLGIYTLFSNLTTYFQFISQATMRFNELSFRKVIQATLTVMVVLALLFIKHIIPNADINYKIYIILSNLILFILFIWYSNTYHVLIFGKRKAFLPNIKVIFDYFKKGFFMTISYQVSVLIFNVDNQYISLFFSTRTYGLYAFAYSLIQMVLTVLNAVSTVLFPYIKRLSRKNAVALHSRIVTSLLIFVFASLIIYYPMNIFISFYLPNYFDSMKFVQILFPGVGVTSCLTLITSNYFMVFGKSRIYTEIGVEILLLSTLLNGGAYYLFKTPFAIAAMSLVVLLIWYFITERYLGKNYSVKWVRNYFYLLLMLISFLLSVQIKSIFVSLFVYVLIYLCLTFAFFKKEIQKSVCGIIKNLDK